MSRKRDERRRVKEKRSGELRDKDALPRTLVYEAVAFGFFVRLYYLEPDDSFFLDWNLPEGNTGNKYFVNPEEVRFSFRHCAALLKSLHPETTIKLNPKYEAK